MTLTLTLAEATAASDADGRESSSICSSPIGEIRLVADDSGIRELQLPGSFEAPGDSFASGAGAAWLEQATEQLGAYFAGELRDFEVPLRAEGTEFQRRVWDGLRQIPFGETWSYGRLAEHVGNVQACRAVGLANGRNPIAVIVPCHRVIGANGTLTGYGGGLDRKAWLLDHERRVRGGTA